MPSIPKNYLNFMPHIHLLTLTFAQYNASSFSIFKDHVSLLCNIKLCTRAPNFSLQKQGKVFSSTPYTLCPGKSKPLYTLS